MTSNRDSISAPYEFYNLNDPSNQKQSNTTASQIKNNNSRFFHKGKQISISQSSGYIIQNQQLEDPNQKLMSNALHNDKKFQLKYFKHKKNFLEKNDQNQNLDQQNKMLQKRLLLKEKKIDYLKDLLKKNNIRFDE